MSTIWRRIREVAIQYKIIGGNSIIHWWQINMTEYGKGGGIQNNLEMYRNLKGTQFTSPVQKVYFVVMVHCKPAIYFCMMGWVIDNGGLNRELGWGLALNSWSTRCP